MNKPAITIAIVFIMITGYSLLITGYFSQSAPEPKADPFEQLAEAITAGIQDRVDELSGTTKPENWKPSEYFDSPELIELCKLIGKENLDVFNATLDGGIDVNQTGRSGITLLHWAYAKSNLAAFELLLRHGADPDLKLTDDIESEFSRRFKKGDSILFAVIRRCHFDYFQVALKHTDSPNQKGANSRDLIGEILHTGPDSHHTNRYGLTLTDLFNQIFDAGMDINGDRPDGVPQVFRFTMFPRVCLRLLEDGAVYSVSDIPIPPLRNRIAARLIGLRNSRLNTPSIARIRSKDRSEEDYQAILDWLDAHEGSG